MSAKEEIIRLLNTKEYGPLLSMSSRERNVLKTLISLTYDKKTLACWRAIETIGLITGELAKTRPDAVRNLVGRLLWMIRDESGGIGWSSPEILGEITRNNTGLCADIPPIILSFIDEDMLTAGVLWATGRIGSNTPVSAFQGIIPYLHHQDDTIRGYAAWAAGEINASGAAEELEKLWDDDRRILIYADGHLSEKSIGALAKASTARLVHLNTCHKNSCAS